MSLKHSLTRSVIPAISFVILASFLVIPASFLVILA